MLRRPNMDVSHIFNKFAGQEIRMTEKKINIKIGKDTYPHTQIEPADPKDPLITGMEETAKKAGMSLRLGWPGVMHTPNVKMNRVNARIEKGDDGKWRIGKKFMLG